MKKYTNYIIIGAVVILLIIGAVATSGKGTRKEPKMKEITYTEWTEIRKSTTPVVVVIGQTGCGYCEQYKPVITAVANEYNITINYIDLTKFSQEENYNLNESITYLREEEWGTPTTLLIQDGDNLEDVIGGYVEKTELVAYLKANNIIES